MYEFKCLVLQRKKSITKLTKNKPNGANDKQDQQKTIHKIKCRWPLASAAPFGQRDMQMQLPPFNRHFYDQIKLGRIFLLALVCALRSN